MGPGKHLVLRAEEHFRRHYVETIPMGAIGGIAVEEAPKGLWSLFLLDSDGSGAFEEIRVRNLA